MRIDVVPNPGPRPAYLLRESYREGKRVRKRTLPWHACVEHVGKGRSTIERAGAWWLARARCRFFVKGVNVVQRPETVEFMGELPKTGPGKLACRLLRERVH